MYATGITNHYQLFTFLPNLFGTSRSDLRESNSFHADFSSTVSCSGCFGSTSMILSQRFVRFVCIKNYKSSQELYEINLSLYSGPLTTSNIQEPNFALTYPHDFNGGVYYLACIYLCQKQVQKTPRSGVSKMAHGPDPVCRVPSPNLLCCCLWILDWTHQPHEMCGRQALNTAHSMQGWI